MKIAEMMEPGSYAGMAKVSKNKQERQGRWRCRERAVHAFIDSLQHYFLRLHDSAERMTPPVARPPTGSWRPAPISTRTSSLSI